MSEHLLEMHKYTAYSRAIHDVITLLYADSTLDFDDLLMKLHAMENESHALFDKEYCEFEKELDARRRKSEF